MKRLRAQLTIDVDLDPVPGWGHSAEDWRKFLQAELESRAPHYNPMVTVTGVSL